MKNIKLIALDLDGTLFNGKSIITDKNKEAIKMASDLGIAVVISTGRPYCGLPFDQIKGLGINYAITTNGAAIYEVPSKNPIHIDCLDNDISFPIFDFLLSKEIHMDAFIDGDAVSPAKCLGIAQNLNVPPALKDYIINTRTRVDDLKEYILSNNTSLQKMTINFQRTDDGTLLYRDEVKEYLLSNPKITVVSGGFNNLEFTKKGVDKGQALIRLANHLNIPVEQTMAVGDSENDLEILRAAGVSVAMGNAIDDIKNIADFVTLSNEEDGVAHTINTYITKSS